MTVIVSSMLKREVGKGSFQKCGIKPMYIVRLSSPMRYAVGAAGPASWVNVDHVSEMCRMEAVLVVPQPESEPSIVFSACADGHVLRWELDADLNADSYKCAPPCF